ncbi:uncharacterized protein LOC144240959 isoform X2 [Crocuta crocuta]
MFQEAVCSSFFSPFSSPEWPASVPGHCRRGPCWVHSAAVQGDSPPHRLALGSLSYNIKQVEGTFCLWSSTGMSCYFYEPMPRMTKIFCLENGHIVTAIWPALCLFILTAVYLGLPGNFHGQR